MYQSISLPATGGKQRLGMAQSSNKVAAHQARAARHSYGHLRLVELVVHAQITQLHKAGVGICELSRSDGISFLSDPQQVLPLRVSWTPNLPGILDESGLSMISPIIKGLALVNYPEPSHTSQGSSSS